MIIQEYQEFKPVQRALGLKADGMPGPKTLAAVALKLRCHEIWSAVQAAVNVTPDGIPGPATARGIAAALDIALPRSWPDQATVRAGLSIFGRAGDESNLVSVVPPYPLYYEGRPVKTIRVHQAIAQDVQAALAEVLAAYGLDRIRKLHLDQYGGSYNDRSTAGGKSKSMHAWGIALDFDPERNSYSCKAPHAGLSRPECEEWWRIWEAHGAVSLGRERNYDWMHLQFARL